ncbi:MAG: hypothetical protein IPK82_35235 [Polyangiaceae bacterium]|nr:hypothetical protein [Polyangiaceae bacterium]
MNYFETLDDMTSRSRWHIGDITLSDGSIPRLRSGHRVSESTGFRAPITHPGKALDFCFTSFAVPILTPQLGNVVASIAGENIQVLPVQVESHDMRIMNVLRIIDCVDEARSEFMKWTSADHRADLAGQYRLITKLVLNARAIPADAHVFRIAGYEVALIVSASVKYAMEQAGCKGAVFRDVTPPLN